MTIMKFDEEFSSNIATLFRAKVKVLLQGDVHISGHVIIDAIDCNAAKFAGAIWADGMIEMSGA